MSLSRDEIAKHLAEDGPRRPDPVDSEVSRRIAAAMVEETSEKVIEFSSTVLTALEKRGKQVPIIYPAEDGAICADWDGKGNTYVSVRFDDGIVTGSYLNADTHDKHVFIVDAFDAEEYVAQLCTIAGYDMTGRKAA